MKRIFSLFLTLSLLVALSGCNSPNSAPEDPETEPATVTERTDLTDLTEDSPAATESAPVTETPLPSETPESEVSDVPESPLPTEEEPAVPAKIVCIDAGHQLHGSNAQEPVGPGASETKARVTGGTQGTTTGIPEYQLNLDVSLLLQEELENRGYSVVMCRTTNEVDLSNAERAAIAAEAGADVFVRIHADGSENASASGCMTICMTESNPYNADLYTSSYLLSSLIQENLVAATDANDRGVWQTDTMSGINWSEVPVTIIEMGYMTNPTEDELMATDAYRAQIVDGIANGIDSYFAQSATTETE